MICPRTSKATTRKPAAPGATACPAIACSFSAPGTWSSSSGSSRRNQPEEQRIAREQLQQIVHYADSAACRRAELLRYFAEEFPGDNCGGCDNCLQPRDTFDGTIAAQKFLSCVYRIKQKSGFGFGLNHVVGVLTGSESEQILQRRHEELSTYGIGRDLGRAHWQAIGRELARMGLVRQSADQFHVLELTEAGREALRERRKIVLTKPMVAPSAPEKIPRAGEIACDEELFERLRQVRKTLADERNVPAYIVFSDVALRQMARYYPANGEEFTRISGVGEKKLREFGDVFLVEIAAHLQSRPRQIFADDSFGRGKY